MPLFVQSSRVCVNEYVYVCVCQLGFWFKIPQGCSNPRMAPRFESLSKAFFSIYKSLNLHKGPCETHTNRSRQVCDSVYV